MNAQTGIAKMCQCCRSKPAKNKLYISDEVNETSWYRYMCKECTSFVKSLEGVLVRVSVHAYVGAVPETDDPLQEVRDVFDELMNDSPTVES